jgi:hypothetical protein
VAEAGPLVFLEALASGCFPIGTYFAGMGASIDAVAKALSPQQAELMKISAEHNRTIFDIATKAGEALMMDAELKSVLRSMAVLDYDWENVSKKLAREMLSL